MNYVKLAVIENPDEKLYNEGYESLIVGVFPYYGSQKSGLFSVYCQIRDYHVVIKEVFEELLSPLNVDNKIFVDISPFSEKELAAKAGLGVIGRNNLLITEEYSSMVFIGEAAVKLRLPEITHKAKNLCPEKCRKCVDACPTGALDNNRFDRSKCLSNLTQKKNLTDADIENLKKASCIFGCDICQLACPLTRPAGELKLFNDVTLDLTREKILSMDDEFFNQNYKKFAFSWRGLEILKRNIKYALR